MKRVLLLTGAIFFALSASANKLVIMEDEETSKPEATKVEEKKLPKGGASAEFHQVDGGFGMGLNMIFGHIVVDGGMTFGESDGIDSEGWFVGAGGNYRCWLGKMFFIEGMGGVAYYHSKQESDGKELSSGGEFGAFLSPRVGLKFGKTWGITGGYRWDFPEFKFDNFGDRGHFTVAVNFFM